MADKKNELAILKEGKKFFNKLYAKI